MSGFYFEDTLMDPVINPMFDPWRHWIDQQFAAGEAWERIETFLSENDVGTLAGLRAAERFLKFPTLSTDDDECRVVWRQLVDAKRKWYEEASRKEGLPVEVAEGDFDRDIQIPTEAQSAWRLYEQHLERKNFKSADIVGIRTSVHRILRRLRFAARVPGVATKGMVVGYVQSGKTANMAGLIAMSADWRWNVVIVLTGTLENLRKQTQARIFSDLNHPGNIHWVQIDRPSRQSEPRTRDLHFGENVSNRHLIVSLKNATRLTNLLSWLKADPKSLEKMRILIIDDEADQASIDTSPEGKEARSKINEKIIELTNLKAASVNYIAFTATPYANFLNEAYPESLYPQDFILSLPRSDEHFGPEQIFGIDGTDSEGGLGFLNEVPTSDVEAVKKLHDGEGDAPNSLAEAVRWFLCAAAAMRVLGGDRRRSLSMLVHTSSTQAHHSSVAEAIKKLLSTSAADVDACLEKCQTLWISQISQLSLETFKSRHPGYGRIDQLNDYPAFDQLVPHIKRLLSRVSAIPMSAEEETNPDYHDGIHLCIDNGANNGINDDGEHVRLLYPSDDVLETLDFSPAFLVVGGSTLSRGLTLENLVSTYFLRGGNQMDTLMQMGRWFGFRRGYELLPRIWTPEETSRKFAFMASVEQELREDLRRFSELGKSPKEFGPRVKVHPKASWLRPTAKNRMKEADGASYDFSGINRQTTIFHSTAADSAKLRANIDRTEHFLGKLGKSSNSWLDGAFVWPCIDFDLVSSFLGGFDYHPRQGFFSDITPFLAWVDQYKSDYAPWNIVVAGTESREKPWSVAGVTVGLIQRTRVKKSSTEISVSIGALRDPKHLVADLPAPCNLPKTIKNADIEHARRASGLENVPQLLIYRVDRSSRAREGAKDRDDLNVPEDLIGLSIWLPGESKGRQTSFATELTVRIPPELNNESDDAIEAAEE